MTLKRKKTTRGECLLKRYFYCFSPFRIAHMPASLRDFQMCTGSNSTSFPNHEKRENGSFGTLGDVKTMPLARCDSKSSTSCSKQRQPTTNSLTAQPTTTHNTMNCGHYNFFFFTSLVERRKHQQHIPAAAAERAELLAQRAEAAVQGYGTARPSAGCCWDR